MLFFLLCSILFHIDMVWVLRLLVRTQRVLESRIRNGSWEGDSKLNLQAHIYKRLRSLKRRRVNEKPVFLIRRKSGPAWNSSYFYFYCPKSNQTQASVIKIANHVMFCSAAHNTAADGSIWNAAASFLQHLRHSYCTNSYYFKLLHKDAYAPVTLHPTPLIDWPPTQSPTHTRPPTSQSHATHFSVHISM